MIVYQKREDGEDIFPGFLVAILFFTISTVRLVSFIDTTINFGLEKALMSFAIDIPFIIILYVFCIYFIYMLFKPPKYYRVTLTDKKEENYENELITYMAFKCSNKKNEKKIPFGYRKCYTYGTNDLILKKEYKLKKINTKERAMLITSLLYGLDKIANTCGHYDAYRKNATLTNELILALPEPNTHLKHNECYNCDTNELVKNISADVVYIDPPYNSRQYSDAYHLIENIARWEKPAVFGVARKMDRKAIKSKYCTHSAPEAFAELIKNINAKYIVVSYNNMAKKGNERSNARISDKEILNTLQSKGNVKTFSEQFKAFTTGKSEHLDNEERLFVCKCN